MKKLTDILEQLNRNMIPVEEAEKQILTLFGRGKKDDIVEEPILIGHLNRKFGYNGVKDIEAGSPVYSFKDRYYFEMTPLNGSKVIIQKFYKESLTPAIDFISDKR